jgi:V8-like Glu-specific endopeptidase
LRPSLVVAVSAAETCRSGCWAAATLDVEVPASRTASERDKAAVSKAISPIVPAAAPSRQNIIDFMSPPSSFRGDERARCDMVRIPWKAVVRGWIRRISGTVLAAGQFGAIWTSRYVP